MLGKEEELNPHYCVSRIGGLCQNLSLQRVRTSRPGLELQGVGRLGVGAKPKPVIEESGDRKQDFKSSMAVKAACLV